MEFIPVPDNFKFTISVVLLRGFVSNPLDVVIVKDRLYSHPAAVA
jgi:hypothetical protein